MAKKDELQSKIATLKKLQEEAAEARAKLEAEIQKTQKEAEQIIPVIRNEINEIDTKIAELQKQKSEKMETLKALGVKIGAAKKGRRGGGLSEKLKALINGVGVGATLTNKDIEEHLESSSGYVGMLIKENLDAGVLERIGAGEYKVISIA